MKRSPWLFLSIPPSPRTPSVTRIPRTDGGHTIPVGLNWTNSMSIRSAPAQSARDWPSPVYSHEFDVTFHALPTPPVASTTALALKRTSLPVLRQYPKAPHTRSPSFKSRSTLHNTGKLVLFKAKAVV